MITAHMVELPGGSRGVRVATGVDAHGQVTDWHDIDLLAVSAWRELLGVDDPVEVLQAIVHVRENGEPEPDPVTGENVWTETYQLLRLREQAREDAAVEVQAHEGHTGYQVQVAAAQMAYRAVHEPINGGECAMDRCRREARGKLGLPGPAKKCGAETRSQRPEMPDRPSTQARAMRPAGGKAQVLDVLADQADYLHECTKRFLHSLTDHDADPLEPEPEPVPTLATPAETLAKYQEAQ